MQLKDCIHFYIGCDCVNSWFPPDHEQYNKGWTLTAIDTTSHNPYKLETHYEDTWTDSVKPILRRLENNTEDDLIQLWAIIGGRPDLFKGLKYGDWDDSGLFLDLFTITQMINRLRSLEYDCDGLIESGEALDAETLKKEP